MEMNQGYVYFSNFTLALFMLNDRKLGEPIKWNKIIIIIIVIINNKNKSNNNNKIKAP